MPGQYLHVYFRTPVCHNTSDYEDFPPMADGSQSGTLAAQDIVGVYKTMSAGVKAGREKAELECCSSGLPFPRF